MAQDSSDIKSLLNQFPVQKFLTKRLLRFMNDEGILPILASMQRFVIDEVVEALRIKLGYNLQDETRIRMVKILIDLLCECEYLLYKDSSYLWSGDSHLDFSLKDEEYNAVETSLKGMVDFFEECIGYAGNFFRGAAPRFSFNNESVFMWEKFLGNAEFNFIRTVLLKLLMCEKRDAYNVLNLCYGPGFDLVQIQERLPDVRLIALDFTDNFHHQAASRLPNAHAVTWIKSELWNGFGSPLPFDDNTVDIVFFTCADPYIPLKWRQYVYRDLFRILKHGGTLGIMTHSYPDRERKYVKDPWIRMGILCHDFSESVCEGWRGFHSAEDSMNLFKEIGYHIYAVMLNAAVWRLDKP